MSDLKLRNLTEEDAECLALIEEHKRELALREAQPPELQETIKFLKATGQPRPKEISSHDWYGAPQDLSHQHELIIMMAASGMPNKIIAEEVGMTPQYISRLLKTSEFKVQIKLRQETLFSDNARKRLDSLIHKAIDTFDNVLSNEQEKSSLKVQVAQYLADQTLGKAKQDVTVQGSLLLDLITRLDQQKLSSPESFAREVVEQDKDPAQTLIESLIDTNFVVGGRTKSEEGQG